MEVRLEELFQLKGFSKGTPYPHIFSSFVRRCYTLSSNMLKEQVAFLVYWCQNVGPDLAPYFLWMITYYFVKQILWNGEE